MDQASEFVSQNMSSITTILFFIVAAVVVYYVYDYMYGSSSSTNYAMLLSGEADGRKPVSITKALPTIYTGGDFTLSMWIYVDNWNYKATQSKFLFALSPATVSPTTTSPLVGLLTPYKNGLLVRGHTMNPHSVPAPGSAPPAATATPDITIESNLQALLNQQTSMQMFESTVDQPCDVKDIPIQRWVNVTIVSSGRTLDVYVDGKLTRSCVLENVLRVPRGRMRLRLGENGGFGGRYSRIQMWGKQVTPDVVYSIYMAGPAPQSYNIFSDLGKYLNLNVCFSDDSSTAGSTPGPTVDPSAGTSSSCGAWDTTAQNLMSRF